MVSRLLFILALLHAKTDAVLEVARPRQTQPKAIRIAPPDSPTTDTGAAPSPPGTWNEKMPSLRSSAPTS